MSKFFQVLWSTPDEPLTPLARYTQANGVFYLLLGAAFYVWPQSTELVGAAELAGQEPSHELGVAGLERAQLSAGAQSACRSQHEGRGEEALAGHADKV